MRTSARAHTIYLWSKIPPEQTQNNSRHFFSLSERERELSRRPETPSREGCMAEWSESKSNRPNLILQPHMAHTHTCTHGVCGCMNVDIHAYSISFLNPWWRTIEWHAEKQKYEGKNNREWQKCFAIQSHSKTMYILKQYGATKQKRMVGGIKRKRGKEREEDGEGLR